MWSPLKKKVSSWDASAMSHNTSKEAPSGLSEAVAPAARHELTLLMYQAIVILVIRGGGHGILTRRAVKTGCPAMLDLPGVGGSLDLPSGLVVRSGAALTHSHTQTGDVLPTTKSVLIPVHARCNLCHLPLLQTC